MNKVKIGILTIAAILAMSFTVINWGEVNFKCKPFSLGAEDCFNPSTQSKGKYYCSDPLISVVAATCNEAVNAFDVDYALSPFHLYALNTSGFIESGNIAATCNGTQQFCCFTIEEDPHPLNNCNVLGGEPNQPLITIGGFTRRWRIKHVYCRP